MFNEWSCVGWCRTKTVTSSYRWCSLCREASFSVWILVPIVDSFHSIFPCLLRPVEIEKGISPIIYHCYMFYSSPVSFRLRYFHHSGTKKYILKLLLPPWFDIFLVKNGTINEISLYQFSNRSFLIFSSLGTKIKPIFQNGWLFCSRFLHTWYFCDRCRAITWWLFSLCGPLPFIYPNDCYSF